MSLGYGRVAAIGPRTGEHGLSCACTDCETGKALVEYKSVLDAELGNSTSSTPLSRRAW
jgi:hypothetical protein